MHRRALSLTFALCLATLPAAAGVTGFHYTREVTVPSPGWVRVPLDLAALQHLAPGAADLHVFGPLGGEVPLRIEAAAPRSERRPVPAPKPRRVEGGWEVTLDVGPDPVPHEHLFLQTAGPSSGPPERIESSPDGSAWQSLAAAEPLPADGGDGSGWAALSYPATTDRYLRLHWPRGADTPRISAAEVEAVTGPTLSVATRGTECDASRPDAVLCALTLPAAGQIVRRLTVEVTGRGDVGYRLDGPREASWRTLDEGIWQRTGGRTRHLIAGGLEPVPDTILRLALHGSPQEPPRLASWAAELAVQTVLFHAEEAGLYTLAYGGPPRAESLQSAVPAVAEVVWLEAGDEIEHAPPALPAAATAPAVRLGTRRLAAAWRVVAPSAEPGLLVRLELPDLVYGAARSDLGNLRLAKGERQIPFYRWSPAAPVLAARGRNLEPTRSGRRSKESELTIRLPEPGLPLTELDLVVPAGPLRRAVGVRYLEPAGNPRAEKGGRGDHRPVIRSTWECRLQSPLPCRERLPLPGRATQVLSVRFHDGENPPLANMEAEVWRRRDVLLFIWPETEEGTPVRLLAGPETLRAPSYDLGALGETLLSHPWQPAGLDLEGEAALAGGPWWSRWVRPMTLTIAAICLLLLLRRILGEARS